MSLEFFEGVQALLARLVRLEDLREPRLICGVDVAYRGEDAVACAVLAHGREIREISRYRSKPPFPYIPGLFYLREGPLILGALKGLKAKPDLVLIDGHGLAHPRRCGIACMIGLIYGAPTIGVAKSLLVGEVGGGRIAEIRLGGEVVGYAVRGEGGRFYISPGHMVDLDSLITILDIFAYEYPWILREADRLARSSI